MAKLAIFGKFLFSSIISASIGLKSFFKPLASMCARYFPSFESKESAYLGESEKCLMIANRNSYNNESASLIYFFGSISLRFIYAKWV